MRTCAYRRILAACGRHWTDRFVDPAEIHDKFEDLEWMQRTRLAEGMLSNDPLHPYALEGDPKVKARNRYINVQAWANCRIHLRVPEGECDFINASPITLKDSVTQEERKYIATQVGDRPTGFECSSRVLAKRATGPETWSSFTFLAYGFL